MSVVKKGGVVRSTGVVRVDSRSLPARSGAAPDVPPLGTRDLAGASAGTKGARLQLEKEQRFVAEGLDELTGALAEVERFLLELDPRVYAAVEICRETDGDPRVPDVVHHLEYSENGTGGWGLHVSSFIEFEGGDDKPVPVARAPKRLRMMAVDHLDGLWEKILEQLQAEGVRARRQAKRARDFVARHRAEAGGGS